MREDKISEKNLNHKSYKCLKQYIYNLSPRYDFFGRNAGLPILKFFFGGLT